MNEMIETALPPIRIEPAAHEPPGREPPADSPISFQDQLQRASPPRREVESQRPDDAGGASPNANAAVDDRPDEDQEDSPEATTAVAEHAEPSAPATDVRERSDVKVVADANRSSSEPTVESLVRTNGAAGPQPQPNQSPTTGVAEPATAKPTPAVEAASKTSRSKSTQVSTTTTGDPIAEEKPAPGRAATATIDPLKASAAGGDAPAVKTRQPIKETAAATPDQPGRPSRRAPKPDRPTVAEAPTSAHKSPAAESSQQSAPATNPPIAQFEFSTQESKPAAIAVDGIASTSPPAAEATQSARSTEPPPTDRAEKAIPQASPRHAGSADVHNGLSGLERVRLVQRVSRAVHSLVPGGGTLRLRLSPPELGMVRLEVTVNDGLLTARLEAESPASRNLLLENVSILRDRLAEQNVQIARFDVDLLDHPATGQPERQSQEDQRHPLNHAHRTTQRNTEPPIDRQAPTPHHPNQLGANQLNVIV